MYAKVAVDALNNSANSISSVAKITSYVILKKKKKKGNCGCRICVVFVRTCHCAAKQSISEQKSYRDKRDKIPDANLDTIILDTVEFQRIPPHHPHTQNGNLNGWSAMELHLFSVQISFVSDFDETWFGLNLNF